jgi:UPF0716 family protein affecting phage T7 exclusion
VKEFVVYTLARIGMFLASLLVFFGLFAVLGINSVLWPLVLAALASGVASYYLLRGQRERFAARVDARARAASRRFEQARAKEDE